MRATIVQSMFFSRLDLAEHRGLAAILGVGFLIVRTEDISLGAATAVLLFLRLFGPIGALLLALASPSRILGVITIPVPA